MDEHMHWVGALRQHPGAIREFQAYLHKLMSESLEPLQSCRDMNKIIEHQTQIRTCKRILNDLDNYMK